MKLIFVALITAVSFASGYLYRDSNTQKLLSGESFMFLDHLSDVQFNYFSARGVWKGEDLANKINAARVLCRSLEQSCVLTQANIISLGSNDYVSLYEDQFNVSKIDDKFLVATNDGQCVRQTLLVDRQSKSVSLVRTKRNQSEECAVVQSEPVSLWLGNPR
jgi:hypothetical protein